MRVLKEHGVRGRMYRGLASGWGVHFRILFLQETMLSEVWEHKKSATGVYGVYRLRELLRRCGGARRRHGIASRLGTEIFEVLGGDIPVNGETGYHSSRRFRALSALSPLPSRGRLPAKVEEERPSARQRGMTAQQEGKLSKERGSESVTHVGSCCSSAGLRLPRLPGF